MNVHLMHTKSDFDLEQDLPAQTASLTQDLMLKSLFDAMAAGDKFLGDVARVALLSSGRNDLETIVYRQEILADFLKYPALSRQIYGLTVEAFDRKRRDLYGFFHEYPSSVLHDAVATLEVFVVALRQMRKIADQYATLVASRGLTKLFTMLQDECSDDYLDEVKAHLAALKFRASVLLSAELGAGNQAAGFALRQPLGNEPNWLQRLVHRGPPAFTFAIDPRDESGARALSDLREFGLNQVAVAMDEAAHHVLGFFERLKTEIAFYVGCLNLHDRLSALSAQVVRPEAHNADDGRFSARELYDVCLALSMKKAIVGSTVSSDRRRLVVITGANQGGKSSFLRAVGVAQVMMQAGLFVGAEAFSADLCTGVFTHFKRKEDKDLQSGKFDEELARMNEIVDRVRPHDLVLLNESFASTSEREGAEIARQVVAGLSSRGVRIFFVTHLYEFARAAFAEGRIDRMFLRAERRADGSRTFRMAEREPLETSYGKDLYQAVFAHGAGEWAVH